METIMDIKKCKSLDEARVEIDKLDDKIVELIAKRNAYIKQIAHFKDSIDEIKSEDRISSVINRLRGKAIEFNLSPNLINDIYIRLIDEMVESEIAEFKNAKKY
jgi:isochorismate pyruvate lyase